MNFPQRLQNHTLVSPASCQQAVLGAMSCACHVPPEEHSGGVCFQLPPPFLPGTPLCSHPGGTSTAVPSTRNQGLCDIGVGAEGSVGNAGTTPRSVAGLVATSPGHEELPLAIGSDECAALPPAAGHGLACARHIRKLWVSSLRHWEGAWGDPYGVHWKMSPCPPYHSRASKTPWEKLDSSPASRLLAQLIHRG